MRSRPIARLLLYRTCGTPLILINLLLSRSVWLVSQVPTTVVARDCDRRPRLCIWRRHRRQTQRPAAEREHRKDKTTSTMGQAMRMYQYDRTANERNAVSALTVRTPQQN